MELEAVKTKVFIRAVGKPLDVAEVLLEDLVVLHLVHLHVHHHLNNMNHLPNNL